ncbi:pyridoxamine 5'-phosphate oxidase family protein [Spirosoma sp.]|uniref:pyridoxamine 5'-phosphate oxidase family protein n=1 Tax=Spirosoma sp. TaxID=1899569 RepID=UPI0026146197|nr:pyridoxamine 5'-phosphate oxidase family protein [Spirosoma sp.]MCX6217208.1 pyridoxamine 5'-phosphate oxidase family protein [Spirosoma sp.]
MLRDLSPEVTDHLLSTQFFGRIGCAADGQVLVLPVSYLYDGQAIYGQTCEGTKTRLLRKNPAVCFEVDDSCGPDCWRSVVVQGVYEELQGDERVYAEQRLGPGRIAPVREAAVGETNTERPAANVVYRIRILSKTGRTEIKSGL